MEFQMRFVGQTEVGAFLGQWPTYGETVRAWVSEMKHGSWHSPAAFAADFKNVDVSNVPTLIFYLAPAGLRIDTLVDFRTRTIMLMTIQPVAMMQSNNAQPWNTQRDH
jgi:mRNA-degrading endonuclease HigB of HigAB toxin-antitoxin module